MDTLQKLQGVFREVFEDKNLVISRETSAKDIEAWDSLAQINLISKSEEVFNVSFEIEEILALKDVGSMVDFIDSKLV